MLLHSRSLPNCGYVDCVLCCRDESVEVEKVEAEEEKQLTLDEWKAMQQRERAKPAFNIRKPGEGCQTAPEWKKMFVLKKKVDDEEEEEEEEYEEVEWANDYFYGTKRWCEQITYNSSLQPGLWPWQPPHHVRVFISEVFLANHLARILNYPAKPEQLRDRTQEKELNLTNTIKQVKTCSKETYDMEMSTRLCSPVEYWSMVDFNFTFLVEIRAVMSMGLITSWD